LNRSTAEAQSRRIKDVVLKILFLARQLNIGGAERQLVILANELASRGHDVIIAVSRVGKGTVFAVGDPWFYNEYLDGRKLPAEYDNYDAARDLVKWLLQQVPTKTK